MESKHVFDLIPEYALGAAAVYGDLRHFSFGQGGLQRLERQTLIVRNRFQDGPVEMLPFVGPGKTKPTALIVGVGWARPSPQMGYEEKLFRTGRQFTGVLI